jgi:hypothetical protein
VGLQPGESITLVSTPPNYATEHSFWEGWFASGTTTVHLFVDSWNGQSFTGAISETNELNNLTQIGGLSVTGVNPPVEEPVLLPIPQQPPAPEAPACDPAYPDFCIPSPPPDLDCTDVTGENFQVLPPDPHGFDGDGNGIGCETDKRGRGSVTAPLPPRRTLP